LKLAKLAPLFPGLMLMACQGLPSPPPAIELPARIGSGQGIDVPTDASDVLMDLEGSGVEFVARYYREPGSRWPALSASEAQRLSSLGLKIVAVWEARSRDLAHFTYSTGYGDAVTAYGEAKAAGQPMDSAIYFAVDFNPRSELLASVAEYFRGVNAGLAAASGGRANYAVGVYGSGAVCDAMKREGLAQYSWLSNSIAWEGSIGYDGWNIRQGGQSPMLSFSQDSDEARGAYGGFEVADIGAAAPYDSATRNVATQPLTTAAISSR
jgi:Rv2525c-like, glycoside hydrolase-like domain